MTEQTQSELHIDARELGFRDLDFPECATALRQYINENISASTASIMLDVRWCVVIYSQAHIFFDSCLEYLATRIAKPTKLIIYTTDNYLTRELTCYELFRTSVAVNENDHDPKSVAAIIDQYCTTNKFSIDIEVYSGDTEEQNAPKLASYTFPASTAS